MYTVLNQSEPKHRCGLLETQLCGRCTALGVGTQEQIRGTEGHTAHAYPCMHIVQRFAPTLGRVVGSSWEGNIVVPNHANGDTYSRQIVTNISFGSPGLHYPCFLPMPSLQEKGLPFWSTEDGGMLAARQHFSGHLPFASPNYRCLDPQRQPKAINSESAVRTGGP